MTPTRARALAAAEGGLAFTKKALMEAAGCGASVIDALVDEGALETLTAAAAAGVRRARSLILPARSRSRTTTRRDRAIGRRDGARLSPLFAGRRHWLGQDRGLFRGCRGGFAERRTGAGVDAGNRADQSVSGAFLGAFRRAAGRVAFRRLGKEARAHLARGGGGRGAGRRRRALGLVPAVWRFASHRRR